MVSLSSRWPQPFSFLAHTYTEFRRQFLSGMPIAVYLSYVKHHFLFQLKTDSSALESKSVGALSLSDNKALLIYFYTIYVFLYSLFYHVRALVLQK